MNTSHLKEALETARSSAAYRNYLVVRDQVLRMIDECDRASGGPPSNYWKEELGGFEYMFEASPLIVAKLREHCYHITGIHAYEYREHHAHRKGGFERKLHMLRKRDRTGLFVPEAPDLGGFGHRIDGLLCNLDTLKFYECFIALEQGGFLPFLAGGVGGRKVVVEIGGGWGGFAYQVKNLFPDITYVIVDLPGTLLFSATYLTSVAAGRHVFVTEDEANRFTTERARDFDFVFVPNHVFDRLPLQGISLAINMVSFQEMTTGQVEGYVRRLAELRCRNLYSLNRDCSRHNEQLSSVSALLEKYYACFEVKVLDIPYVEMPSLKNSKSSVLRRGWNTLAGATFRRAKGKSKQRHRYRHLLGSLRA